MAGVNINIRFEYQRTTDVMYVEWRGSGEIAAPEIAPEAVIRAVQLGSEFGDLFDGRVVIRIGPDGHLVGATILRFSSMKRRLMWSYRVLSWRRALRLLITSLAAGFDAQRSVHPQPA